MDLQDVLDQYRAHFAKRFAVLVGATSRSLQPLHGVGGATMMELFAATASSVTPSRPVRTRWCIPTLPFPTGGTGAWISPCRADEVGSSLVIANDPDADRLGAAVRDDDGWHVLRGDQIGWLLASAMLPTMSDPVTSSRRRSCHPRCCERWARRGRYFHDDAHWIQMARARRRRRVLRLATKRPRFRGRSEVADKDGSRPPRDRSSRDDLRRHDQTLIDRLDEIETRYESFDLPTFASR